MDQPNVYDPLLKHAEARREAAPKDRANTVCSLHDGVAPLNTDKILSEFVIRRSSGRTT